MKGKRAPFLILAGLVIAVQLVTTLTGTEFYLTQLIMAALYSIVVIGLCLLMGYAGQISLGHAGFFAIGGYTAATLTTLNLFPYRATFIVRLLEKSGLILSDTNSWGAEILYLSPWLSLVAALLISGSVAFLIGIPVLRLKGHYLAMATLGFGTIVYRIALGSAIFGEADGISDVPGFPLLGGLIIDGSRSQRVFCYYFVWVLVLGLLTLVSNLVDSRSGRALRAIHGNEEAAEAMGVDTSRLKLYLFVLSALFATIAGVFLTHYNGGLGPSEAGVMKSVRYVAIVAVGGMASLWGTLSAGILLNFLSLRGYFGSLDDAVFGSVLIAVMLFAPQGILRHFRPNRSAEEKAQKKKSEKSQPQTEKEKSHGAP
jgi:branched-chain amino acid transport system permease protein